MAETSIKRIGRYEIQEELGRGGYGRVFRAYDPTVGRMVAIKILTAEGKDLLTRFRNEAAAAGNLNHRNIVTIYDFGDYEGVPYIAMEFLAGDDLSHLIANRTPLTLLQKVSVMLQVAEGLFCAHRNGVVHRDVKPANIRLLPDGTVKIMDFGIARLTRDSATPRLTLQGDLIGTLLYMSPEQVMGGDVDSLSDIFAYGVTYYELLTGKHPFHASDPGAVLYKITSQDPQPLRVLAPECPDALEHVIRRALQRERELRYPDLRDVVIDTEPILLELRQERAGSLLTEAKDLFGAGELERAQTLAMEALDLDPANRETRELRAAIQQRLQRLLLQPRIDELTAKGQTAIEHRRISEAVESFESAQRLDPANDSLKARALQARELLERNRASVRLLSEARRQFARHELAAALQSAAEALQHDAGNADAERFLQQVRAAHERKRQFEDTLAKARNLLDQDLLEQADGVLETLEGDQRDSPAAKELLEVIARKRAEQERGARLREGLKAVSELFEQAAFARAIEHLNALASEFSDEPRIKQLLDQAQGKLRAQGVENAGRDVRGLIQENQVGRARDLLNSAQQAYPGEPLFEALRAEVDRAETAWLRRQAIDEALASAQTMRTKSDYEGALGALDKVRRECGDDPAISTLFDQIGAEREVQAAINEAESLIEGEKPEAAIRRLEDVSKKFPAVAILEQALAKAGAALERKRAIEQVLQRADALNSQSEFDEAIRLLESAKAEHTSQPVLEQALNHAREGLAQKLRLEAVDQAEHDARALLDKSNFVGARAVLTACLKTYSGEPRLEQLQREVDEGEAAWMRRRAIEEAVTRADTLRARAQFDAALNTIETARKKHGDDPALSGLAEKIAADRKAFRRAEAIRTATSKAESLVKAGDLEQAIRGLETATKQYAEEPVLEKALKRAREALAERQKTEAVGRAESEARALMDRGDFGQALKGLASYRAAYVEDRRLKELEEQLLGLRKRAIEEGLHRAEALSGQAQFEAALNAVALTKRKQGDDPALSALAERIRADREAFRKAEAVRAVLVSAQSLVDDGQLEEAVRALGDSAKKYACEPAIEQALTETREALAAKQKAEVIDRAASEAKALLERNEFMAAREVLDTGLRTYPDESRLTDLRQEVVAREEAWTRTRAVEETANRVEDLCRQKQFEEALDAVNLARQKLGDEPLFSALSERIGTERDLHRRAEAVQAATSKAGALVEAGNLEEAVRSLESAIEQYGHEPGLEQALERARDSRVRQQKAAAIKTAEREIKGLLEQNEFVRARAILTDCQTAYPGDSRLEQLYLQVETLRRRAIDEAVNRAEALREQGQFDAALEMAEEARRKHGDDRSLSALADKINADHDAFRRSQALQRIVADAESLIKARESGEAIAALESAAREYAGESVLERALERARIALAEQQKAEAIERSLRETRTHINNTEFVRARDVLASCLRVYPGESRIEELQREVEKLVRAAIEDAVNRAEALRQERQFEAALNLVHEAARKHLDDPALSELAKKIGVDRAVFLRSEAVGTALAKAESLAGAGQLHEAIRVLEAATKQYVGEASLEGALRQTNEALAQKLKAEAIDKAEAQIKGLLERSEFAQARRVLNECLRSYPGDSRLSKIERELGAAEAAWNRRRAIEEALSRAETLRTQQQFDKALKTIDNCRRKHGDDPALSTLAEKIRAESESARRRAEAVRAAASRAESLLKAGQPQEAIQFLESAKTEYPAEPALERALAQAREALAREQKAAAIATAEQEVKAILDRGDFVRARELMAAHLATYPGESRLQQLQREIDSAEAASMRRRAIEEAISRAEALREKQQLDNALKVIETARRKHGDDPALAALAGKIASERALLRRPEAVQPAIPEAGSPVHESPPPVVKPASFITRPRAIAVGAAIAAALAAIIVVPRLLRQSAPDAVSFEVRTTPPGAIVRFGSGSCVTPNCSIQLPPGEHTFQVRLIGYSGQTAKATISRDSSPRGLDINLEPLPSTLQLTTNFGEGAVALDGRSAGQLRDGQLVVDSVKPGQHRLEVTSKDGALTLSFEAGAARKPSIVATPQTQRLDAVLVTAFDGEATITCGNCSGEAFVDGVSKGRISDGRLTVTGLSEGAHDLEIRDGSNSRKLVFRIGDSPLLSAHLTSTQDRGILLVETGQEDAVVFINGRRWPRQTNRGVLTMTLDAEEYVIRVEKPGYRASPSEIRAAVRKGEQVRAPFRLEPVEATLTISGQVPGATVILDGRRVGSVNTDGVFSTSVPPGVRQIELSKEGYQPVTISRLFGAGAGVRLDAGDLHLQAVPKPPEPKPSEPKIVQTTPAPAPPPRPDPAEIEAQQWERVRTSRDVRELADFLARHPGGRFARQAEARIEELDWSAADKNNKAALETFLRKHPKGTFADPAAKAIAGLEEAERQRGEVNAILAIINRYQEAYKREDADSVRALFVNMPAQQFDEIRRSFRVFQVVNLQLTPEAPQVSGNTAVVRCTRNLLVKDNRGEYPVSDIAVFTLSKQGGEWRIANMDSQKQ